MPHRALQHPSTHDSRLAPHQRSLLIMMHLTPRMTYGMLLSYAWQKDFCHPAQERLAADLGVSDRSVRTFLAELRDNRLVTWKQQGLNKPNIYYLLKLPDAPDDTLHRTGKFFRSGPEAGFRSRPAVYFRQRILKEEY